MRPTPTLLAAAALALACGDSTAPTMASVAGTYQATTFTVLQNGATTDLLANGSSLALTLAADGTTAGRVFVPGGGEAGADFDEDLTGTWVLQDSTVTLDHPADTFLRDMTFTVGDRRLSGEATFSGTTITVVMTK
jgi:hypothetical protein